MESYIDAGVSLLTSLSSLASPQLAIISTTLSPLISTGAKKILPKSLAEREEIRVKQVFQDVIDKIKIKILNGCIPRIDEAYYEYDNGIPNAQEVFEGVLLKAREEFQSKKMPFYSNFFANLCFDERINIEHAQFLLSLIERLTYRQLSVLAYLTDNKEVNTNRWDALFKIASNSGLMNYYDFYSEYIDLYNTRLVTQTGNNPGFALGMSKTRISEMGLLLSNLLELQNIPGKDLENIKKQFDAISAIISRI